MTSLRTFASLIAVTLLAAPHALGQARPTFPTPTAAAASLADSIRSSLFQSGALESPRFHLLAGPAVRSLADALADRLTAIGYVRATRDRATILLHVTLESSHAPRDERSLRRVRVTPVVPAGEPIEVEHAALSWVDAPPRHRRVISSLQPHLDRDAALGSALVAARHALAKAAADRAPELARPIRTALSTRSRDEIAADAFVARDDAGYYRAHLLVSLAPERVERIVAQARDRRRARERHHLFKWLLFGSGVLLVITVYAWADGRTRGYLRGPLRCAAAGGVAVLVFGLWVV